MSKVSGKHGLAHSVGRPLTSAEEDSLRGAEGPPGCVPPTQGCAGGVMTPFSYEVNGQIITIWLCCGPL